MAKPPIIISNGGLAGFLAQGIDDPEAELKILANLSQLNENTIREEEVSSVAKWLIAKNRQVPMIFWHLTSDDLEYQLGKLKSKFKEEDIELGEELYPSE